MGLCQVISSQSSKYSSQRGDIVMGSKRNWHLILSVVAILAIVVVMAGAPASDQVQAATPDIHTIQHVVIIMQENRSFDSYFGTFPGADGIPMQNGVPTMCVPDKATWQCVKPYHNTADVNTGGPHGETDATQDIDGGKMDGFINSLAAGRKKCKNPDAPACTQGKGQAPDVMGYHDATE